MGKLAHDRWIDPLTVMVKDESPQVRSTALRALMEIRRHESAAVRAPNLENSPEVVDDLIKLASQGGILAEQPESLTLETDAPELCP